MPKLPPGFPPGFPDKMEGMTTAEDIIGDKQFYMEWSKAIEAWKEYADWGVFVVLEIAHLVVAGTSGLVLTAITNEVEVPEIKLVSPMSAGAITINATTLTGVTSGKSIFVADVEFPIKNETKTLTVDTLDTADKRRPDRIFLAVRLGSSLYARPDQKV